jgi:hypothetical protein
MEHVFCAADRDAAKMTEMRPLGLFRLVELSN